MKENNIVLRLGYWRVHIEKENVEPIKWHHMLSNVKNVATIMFRTPALRRQIEPGVYECVETAKWHKSYNAHSKKWF